MAKRKPKEEHKPSGRPKLEIDLVLLTKLAESMLPIDSIAKILGCNPDTLYSRFSEHLQKAREGRKMSLTMVMWDKALNDKDTKMMIWLSKQHLGYREHMPEEATQINFIVNTNEVPK